MNMVSSQINLKAYSQTKGKYQEVHWQERKTLWIKNKKQLWMVNTDNQKGNEWTVLVLNHEPEVIATYGKDPQGEHKEDETKTSSIQWF